MRTSHISAAVLSLTAASLAFAAAACDSEDKGAPATPAYDGAAAPPAAAPTPTPAPEVRAPDIVVDPGYVAIGNDRVPSAGGGLVERIGVFLSGRPMIEGQAVDVVAMRNAKPSEIAAVLAALERVKAAGAGIKTEARDGSTQRLPLSFASPAQPCATIAWIAKDAAIDVWPVAGGRAKKVIRGLAGPDMTLGLEAVRSAAGSCDASTLVVGADEAMTWGLIFDLAMSALTAPGARTSAAHLVTAAVPGRKLAPPDK